MKIYNTLQRKKTDLTPITPNQIKMYICGQTVYNDIHIGNARLYVVFDAIRRYLLHKKYDVIFVQNFTDIDDKIIIKANAENLSTEEISTRYIERTLQDLDALNCLRATHNPLATNELPAIITLIETLIKKGYAYENNGTVYYSVKKFADYGKLSGKNIDDLEAGARVEVEAGKRDPMDFVLWKPAKPAEPKWDSPWGQGRPGWHIECSAMVMKYLGEQIDIHGGGEDLIFPHHENEIAQTEAATGNEFSRIWMHCGVLTREHKKMSKSKGNFFTLREISEQHPHEVIRFFLLTGHYRMPMEFTDDTLIAAQQGLARIKNCYGNLQFAAGSAEASDGFNPQTTDAYKKFTAAMDDDFNTADAITAIFEHVKRANLYLAEQQNYTPSFFAEMAQVMRELCDVLGIDIHKTDAPQISDMEIEQLIAQRANARKDKNFAEADRLRDEIANMGIILEDTPAGVRWRRG